MFDEKMSKTAGRYTELKADKDSGKYFGRCPFCRDTVPTFCADDRTAVWFCYACGRGGNAGKLVSMMEPKRTAPRRKAKDPVLVSMNNEAAWYYYGKLSSEEGREALGYLAGRGITRTDIEAFGLGYAPKTGNGLYGELKNTYSEKELAASGLFRKAKEGGIYDAFRNRVTFPIMDDEGDVIAFGARRLSGNGPKYINSPETALFSKRETLYGYPYGTEERAGGIVICEGYMDLIAIQSHGMKDAAAVLGTALTKEHARIIARDYREAYLSLDSDAPGINAAKKSISVLRDAGLTVKVIDLAPWKDPDESIRNGKNGMENFRKRVAGAVPSEIFLARNFTDIGELTDILRSRVP